MTDLVIGSWAEGVDPRGLSEPRGAALWVIERTLLSRRPAADWMVRVESQLESRDRALLHQLVTGILRWALRLDDVLVQVGGRPVGMIDPRLLGPLRLGALQLLFLDRIPAHAAVNESVRLAQRKSRPGSRFVNAILRKLAKNPELEHFPVREGTRVVRMAIEASHPVLLVQRWLEVFGEERTEQILAANNAERRPAFLVVEGPERRQELIEELTREGVETSRGVLAPAGLRVESGQVVGTRPYSRGAFYPQDEASQCAALVPSPVAGERILDAAAAPGGKTLSLLSIQSDLQVLAADRSLRRIATLVENRRRTGRRFGIVASDAADPPFRASFDRVLADLPCSGTGTIRKHPEIKWRLDDRELRRLAGEASVMLDGLAALVKPGGLLVVATCSIEPEENEQQVESFLARHSGFERTDLGGRVPGGTDSALETSDRWRLLPSPEHDGFTVHVLQRIPIRS